MFNPLCLAVFLGTSNRIGMIALENLIFEKKNTTKISRIEVAPDAQLGIAVCFCH